ALQRLLEICFLIVHTGSMADETFLSVENSRAEDAIEGWSRKRFFLLQLNIVHMLQISRNGDKVICHHFFSNLTIKHA
ncbi:hypothetical protein PENTCL1PPCAC_25726, partial [Pristionchus entomophagus]